MDWEPGTKVVHRWMPGVYVIHSPAFINQIGYL
jgi:hypothetical protein